MKSIAAFLCLVAFALPAAAQDAQPPPVDPDTLKNLPVPKWARAALASFSKPLHPVIGGVATNGGVGAGIGYNSPDEQRAFTTGKAMFTLRRFWSFEGEIGRRSLSRRSQIGAFAVVRDMGRLDYFGIGPGTELDNRAAFGLREMTWGARGWFRLAPALRLGTSISAYKPDLRRTNSSSLRPIEAVFADESVPGLASDPLFGRYRAFIELRHPAPNYEPLEDTNEYRGAYQLAFESLHDQGSGRYSLHRWEFEVQQGFRGLTPNQRLTLHGFLATTNTDADVPFYLLYTLGGTGGLKTFRPEMIGGDGTRATLRGFRNFRFRDRDLVLMQAEYRIPVHKYVRTSVFVDTGQVAPRTSELFSDIRGNTGFSVSAVNKGKTLGRMDVGFGGGEGVYFYWSFGAFQD